MGPLNAAMFLPRVRACIGTKSRNIMLNRVICSCCSVSYTILLFRMILNITNNELFLLSIQSSTVLSYCCHRATTQTNNYLIIFKRHIMINFIKSQSESTLFIGLALFLGSIITTLYFAGLIKE